MTKEGNLEAQNLLQAENKIRQEQNRPSVEQELQMIVEKAEKQNSRPSQPMTDEIPMSTEEKLMMEQMEIWNKK